MKSELKNFLKKQLNSNNHSDEKGDLGSLNTFDFKDNIYNTNLSPYSM